LHTIYDGRPFERAHIGSMIRSMARRIVEEEASYNKTSLKSILLKFLLILLVF